MANVLLPAFLAVVVLCFVPVASAETGRSHIQSVQSADLPFKSGERFTYEISWSRLIQAGTAIMEIREESRSDGKQAYRIVSHAYSGEFLSKFYKVSDTIESTVAVDEKTSRIYSLSYHMDQHHGKRIKKRDMTFDRAKGTVLIQEEGQQRVYSIPENVQDALSSLYYVRAEKSFIQGKPLFVNVHEDGKTWAVEVQTLGRERLDTAFGELNTIKVRTYPRYEGVFQNKGEITIWLTDDARKIPVLMKSTISIGSIVATLVDLRIGEDKNDGSHGIKAPLKPH
jgi:hypothetical protein